MQYVFSALTANLKDKMEESDFNMPPLNNMVTKALQIEGLRTVRISAVAAHKALNDEEKRIRRLFPQLQGSRQPRGGTHQYHGYQRNEQTGHHNDGHQGNQGNRQASGEIHFHGQSQAETTLSKYGGGGASTNALEVATRVGADGKQYPYNPDDPGYLSKFPVGWRGCYKCGKEDHWKREFCPDGNNTDPVIMEAFHRELRCHKPAFRQQSYSPRVSSAYISTYKC